MSQLVQVIRSGARKGHNRRFLEQSYEMEPEFDQDKLYPVIGAGTMAAALLITQSDKLQVQINRMKPISSVDRATQSESASVVRSVTKTTVPSPIADTVNEVQRFEDRVTASLPPAREMVPLSPQPTSSTTPPPSLGKVEAPPAVQAKKAVKRPEVSNLIRAEPSGVESIADQVLTSVQRVGSASKSYFDLLSGVSTTEYLIQLFQPSVSEVQNQLLSVGKASLSFLDAHPELKLSTSDYLARIFEPQVKELSSSIADVGMESLKFLDQHPELKLSTSEYLAKLIQPKVNEIVGSFGVVGEKSTAYLDANPDLKLPTSKYLTKLVEVELKPKLVEYLKVQSKVILDENPDFKLTTSEYFKKIIQPQIDSSLVAIKEVSNKFITDAVDAASSTANRVVTNAVSQAEQQIARQTSRVGNPLPQVVLAPSDVDRIADQVLSSVGATASFALNSVADASSKFVEASGPALARAGSTFASELGEAGIKLGTNLVSGLEYTGEAIGRLTSSSLKSILTPDTYLSAIPAPKLSSPVLPSPPNFDKLASKLSDIVSSAQSW